jgi:hypothetical protein
VWATSAIWCSCDSWKHIGGHAKQFIYTSCKAYAPTPFSSSHRTFLGFAHGLVQHLYIMNPYSVQLYVLMFSSLQAQIQKQNDIN